MLKTRKIELVLIFSIIAIAFVNIAAYCQSATVLATGSGNKSAGSPPAPAASTRLLYGQASYYASKFEGRKTANGEIFKQNQMTAACNVLPLGTWVRVTNLRNGKSIVVRTNDRLHVKTRRIVDLTRTGAQQLGYIKSGLTRVKVEVLNQKPYKKLK
jgi:rare lipoprotein A